jgi:hypothetical protein
VKIFIDKLRSCSPSSKIVVAISRKRLIKCKPAIEAEILPSSKGNTYSNLLKLQNIAAKNKLLISKGLKLEKQDCQSYEAEILFIRSKLPTNSNL